MVRTRIDVVLPEEAPCLSRLIRMAPANADIYTCSCCNQLDIERVERLLSHCGFAVIKHVVDGRVKEPYLITDFKEYHGIDEILKAVVRHAADYLEQYRLDSEAISQYQEKMTAFQSRQKRSLNSKNRRHPKRRSQ